MTITDIDKQDWKKELIYRAGILMSEFNVTSPEREKLIMLMVDISSKYVSQAKVEQREEDQELISQAQETGRKEERGRIIKELDTVLKVTTTAELKVGDIEIGYPVYYLKSEVDKIVNSSLTKNTNEDRKGV